ncbi:uncharacterized protein LOC121248278, partial [Juglans microcarpa x Juglans regia]|uniref:uncharacterized protein LOC121248278 n=1 Tax=Juglans microcarpa x Juglans regia TaxID=2249226 RepID=UPI001B7E9455
EARQDEIDTGVVYYGPISSTIKKVNLLSLTTCCLSVSLGPVPHAPVITFMTSPDMNVILKSVIASSVIFLSDLLFFLVLFDCMLFFLLLVLSAFLHDNTKERK